MMENKNIETKKSIVRIGGLWKEIVTIRDETGAILSRVVQPLKVEFHAKDVTQVVVGATLLAIPVGFTEEVWVLSETLPRMNIVGVAVLSLTFLSLFTYYNYYRGNFFAHKLEFIKRVVVTYVLSLLVVGIFLTVIGKAYWFIDWAVSVKRIILVALPASMSAAVADMVK